MLQHRLIIALSAIGVVAGSMTGMAAGFPEKDITFVIPNRAGGGFDVYARATARFMQKYLPNKVNVVPKNMVGAGGRKGTTAVYRSKPDGYTFVILNIPGIVIPQILGQKVAYDIGKLTFIGRLSSDKYAIVVRKNSKFKSIADLQKAATPTKFVSLSPGMTQYVSSKISTSALGINAAEVSGYRGIRGMLVALIRGDGDAAVTAVQTAIPFFESGDVVPLAFLSAKSLYAGVPTANDVGNSKLGFLGLETHRRGSTRHSRGPATHTRDGHRKGRQEPGDDRVGEKGQARHQMDQRRRSAAHRRGRDRILSRIQTVPREEKEEEIATADRPGRNISGHPVTAV